MASIAVLSVGAQRGVPDDAPRHGADRRRRRDRRHRDPVRRARLGHVRHRHDADLDRRGRQLPRLLHEPRRRAAAGEHDARRGRARRHRFGPVRHVDPRRHHRLRRRPDGRANAGVPGQEARRPRGQVRLAVPADHAGARPRPARRSAMALPGERASMLNTGPHGLSEVLYAFTSAANNNGSAFAGISVNTHWYNYALGIAMLLGPLPADGLRARPCRLAGAAETGRPPRTARCPPTDCSSSAC